MADKAALFKKKILYPGTGCHIWRGAKDKDGYGQFKDGTTRQAHIWAWEQANGEPLPEGGELDHVCRERACVNPEHLELVTHEENMRRQREAVQAKKNNEKLPERRRRFVEAYLGEAKGNASEAARIAGYAKAPEEGCRLLKDAKVQAEIQRLSSQTTAKHLRSREEWMEWVQKMMDQAEEDRDRLKAAELYGKAMGVFVQRVEHSGPGGNPIEIASEQAEGVRRLLGDERSREYVLSAVEVLGGARPGTA